MTTNLIFSTILVSFVISKPYGGPGFRGQRNRPPTSPPCGIPQFVDELSEEFQAKLKEIWKNYKLGSKCYIEQANTVELLDSLPENVRTSLQSRPPLPAFLSGLPKDIISQFDHIFFNKTIPFADRIKQLDELGEKVLPAENLKIFHEDQKKKAEQKKHYDDLGSSLHDVDIFKTKIFQYSKLSPAAKEVDDQVREMIKQRFALVDKLDDKTKKELYDLWDARPYIPH